MLKEEENEWSISSLLTIHSLRTGSSSVAEMLAFLVKPQESWPCGNHGLSSGQDPALMVAMLPDYAFILPFFPSRLYLLPENSGPGACGGFSI